MKSKNQNPDYELLLPLLDRAIETENTIRNTSRSTMNFYSTILLTLTGGILYISQGITDRILFILLFLVGGICLFYIPIMAYQHYKSDYRRQIEYITIQAKIEDVLGLTDTEKYQTSYWNHEPIIPLAFVDYRKEHASSFDFVESFIRETDTKNVRRYYAIFQVVGVIYVAYALYTVFHMVAF